MKRVFNPYPLSNFIQDTMLFNNYLLKYVIQTSFNTQLSPNYLSFFKKINEFNTTPLIKNTPM
jgi:hypothetical protein